jgi:hypothetical protein
MHEHGTGRPPHTDHALEAALTHRKAQVAAALAKARRDDAEREALSNELAEIDEAIAKGVSGLSEEDLARLRRRYLSSEE